METQFLFLPPVAFALILIVSLALAALSSRLACRPTTQSAGKTKAYACGEDIKETRGRTEYSQFFPFAFFFTIMHVIVLVLATAPAGDLHVSLLAGLYLLFASMGLLILYRS